MKRKKSRASRKARDLPAATGKTRSVRGGAIKKKATVALSPPAPPGGPIPIPYPN